MCHCFTSHSISYPFYAFIFRFKLRLERVCALKFLCRVVTDLGLALRRILVSPFLLLGCS